MRPKERRSYHLKGRVQGVGFRWWTRGEAMRLGLAGTVRNLPDGSLLIDAEGDPKALDELQKRLMKGPPTASVSEIIELDPPDDDLPSEFTISY